MGGSASPTYAGVESTAAAVERGRSARSYMTGYTSLADTNLKKDQWYYNSNSGVNPNAGRFRELGYDSRSANDALGYDRKEDYTKVGSIEGIDVEGNKFSVAIANNSDNSTPTTAADALTAFDQEYNRRLKAKMEKDNEVALLESEARALSATQKLKTMSSRTGANPFTKTSISRPTITPSIDSYSTLLGNETFGA